jgi:flagellar basal body rod protein FlgF
MNHSVGALPVSIAIGDMDHDGRPDVMLTSSGWVAVLLGNGHGGLGGLTKFGVGDGSGSVAAADLDRDGRVDLAVASTIGGTGRISILINQLGP